MHQIKTKTAPSVFLSKFKKPSHYCIRGSHWTTTNCLSVFDHYVGRPATLLKKRLWHRCFPVNFEKFLRTPFLQNTSGKMLLLYLTRFSNVSYFNPTHKLSKWKFRISIRGPYHWNEFLTQTEKEIESTCSFKIVT